MPSDWRITVILSNVANSGQIKCRPLSPKTAALAETLNPLFQITEDVKSGDAMRYVLSLIYLVHIQIMAVFSHLWIIAMLQKYNINFRLVDGCEASNKSAVVNWLRADNIPGSLTLEDYELLQARSLSLCIKHSPVMLSKTFGDKKSLSYSNLNDNAICNPDYVIDML